MWTATGLMQLAPGLIAPMGMTSEQPRNSEDESFAALFDQPSDRAPPLSVVQRKAEDAVGPWPVWAANPFAPVTGPATMFDDQPDPGRAARAVTAPDQTGAEGTDASAGPSPAAVLPAPPQPWALGQALAEGVTSPGPQEIGPAKAGQFSGMAWRWDIAPSPEPKVPAPSGLADGTESADIPGAVSEKPEESGQPPVPTRAKANVRPAQPEVAQMEELSPAATKPSGARPLEVGEPDGGVAGALPKGTAVGPRSGETAAMLPGSRAPLAETGKNAVAAPLEGNRVDQTMPDEMSDAGPSRGVAPFDKAESKRGSALSAADAFPTSDEGSPAPVPQSGQPARPAAEDSFPGHLHVPRIAEARRASSERETSSERPGSGLDLAALGRVEAALGAKADPPLHEPELPHLDTESRPGDRTGSVTVVETGPPDASRRIATNAERVWLGGLFSQGAVATEVRPDGDPGPATDPLPARTGMTPSAPQDRVSPAAIPRPPATDWTTLTLSAQQEPPPDFDGTADLTEFPPLGQPPLAGPLSSGTVPLATVPGGPMSQLSAAIVATLQQRSNGRTEISLSPDELGHVQLRLETDAVDPDRMVVHLVFDRPETMDLFRRHADLLSDAIRASGYAEARLDFGQSGTETGQGGSEDAGKRPAEALARHAGESGVRPRQASDVSLPTQRPTGGAGLDLRL